MSQPMTPVRVMVNTVAVLTVVGLAWLLIQIQSIILLVIVGIIFAAAIEPLVNRLRRAGLTRGQSIMAVYVCLITLLSLALYLVIPPLVRQATALGAAIPQILDDLQAQALASENSFLRHSGYQTLLRMETAYVRTTPALEQDQALGLMTSAFGIVLTTISFMIVAFYWLTEKAIIKRLILGLFPLTKRDQAHAIWDEIEFKLGGWTRGQLTLMTIIGVGSGAGYFVLGLPFWLPLGIFAGLTALIPFIGPFIGGTAAAMVALADSWEKALIVVAFVFVLQQIEGAVLVPRVMTNAVGMSPLTVVLAVLVGGVWLGPVGAILGIPVGAAVQVLVQNLLRRRDEDFDIGLRPEPALEAVTRPPPPRPEELPIRVPAAASVRTAATDSPS